MHWVSNEIKQEYMDKLTEKKTEVNQQSLEKAFRNILEKYGVRPNRLRVKEGKTGLFEILSLNNNHSNIELTYNPVTLSFYDQEEIESMLYHEAFHPVTQRRGAEISVPDTSPELMDYLSDFTVAYNEYVTYADQSEYYETNQAFLRVKLKELSNYSVILSTLRYFMSNGLLPNPLFPHITLIKILTDALYFRLYNKSVLESWAQKYHTDAILRFYDWIVENFRVIHTSNQAIEDIFMLTQSIGGLTISVDISEMVFGNRIEFSADAFDVYQCRTRDESNPIMRTIAHSWLNRFNSNYS